LDLGRDIVEDSFLVIVVGGNKDECDGGDAVVTEPWEFSLTTSSERLCTSVSTWTSIWSGNVEREVILRRDLLR
jgi:hypothetical protein